MEVISGVSSTKWSGSSLDLAGDFYHLAAVAIKPKILTPAGASHYQLIIIIIVFFCAARVANKE